MHNTIRDAREAAGMTQEALAKKAGVSRPFLSNVENGFAVPTVKKASDIAQALATTIDALFGVREEDEKGVSSEPIVSE